MCEENVRERDGGQVGIDHQVWSKGEDDSGAEGESRVLHATALTRPKCEANGEQKQGNADVSP